MHRRALCQAGSGLLLLTIALPLAAPARAQGVAPLAPPAPRADDPIERLGLNLRLLAQDPRSLAALTGAGHAALEVGDASAAVGFYARAQEVAPTDGRVKAGLAAALVQLEQPRDALRLFDKAKDLGVPEAEFAADRGLAYDLRGDGRRAQADYRLALARGGANDETVRRLALSLAMSGDRAGALATLDPLLRRQDRAAWRASTFVLAMTGDTAAADDRVRLLMTPQQAQSMQPFLDRLAALKPSEQAAAVHFGHFPSTGQGRGAGTQLAAASPSPASVPARAPDRAPVQAGAPAASLPAAAGSMFADAFARPAAADARAARRRPGPVDAPARADRVAAPIASGPPPAVAPLARPATPAPAVAAVATAPTTSGPDGRAPAVERTAPGVAAFAPPAGVASAAAAPPERSAVPPRLAAAAPRPATPAPSSPVPATAPPADAAAAERSPITGTAAAASPAAIARLEASAAAGETGDALPHPAPTPRAAPPATDGAAVRLAGAASAVYGPPTSLAAPSPEVATASTAPAPAPEQPAAGPPGMAAAAPAATGGVVPATPAAIDGAAPVAPGVAPPVDAATRRDASAPASTTPGRVQLADAAPTARAAPARAAPVAERAPAPAAPADAVPAPAHGRKDAAAAAKPADDAKTAKAKAAAAKEKAAAAKDKAARDAEAKAKAAKEAEDKRQARKEPERYWVQVAGGANKHDLPKAWEKARAQHPQELAGKTPHTTPLRFTNRLLVGPFKSEDEAQAFVNRTAKGGWTTFAFTSPAGQKVETLPAK